MRKLVLPFAVFALSCHIEQLSLEVPMKNCDDRVEKTVLNRAATSDDYLAIWNEKEQAKSSFTDEIWYNATDGTA